MSEYVTTRRGSYLRERRGVTKARVLERHEWYVLATTDGTWAFRIYLGDMD